MKNRFELLVFDWDGTLFDSIPWIVECLQRAAADSGLPLPGERLSRSVIGLSLAEAMKTLFPEADESDVERLMA
ncbi:MAG: HAD hydrolase-like protein, partial [Methylococcaceae bacterium]|nr:HAD hydrolase-like protein [Methylococcaceae bacterium]